MPQKLPAREEAEHQLYAQRDFQRSLERCGNCRTELTGGQVFVDELDSSRESFLVSRKAESGQTTEVVDHVRAQGEVSQEAGK